MVAIWTGKSHCKEKNGGVYRERNNRKEKVQ